MAEQSKIAASSFKKFLQKFILGNRKKQLISATILLIIGFLLHIRNKKSYTETLKLKLNKSKVIIALFRAEKVMLILSFLRESKNWLQL